MSPAAHRPAKKKPGDFTPGSVRPLTLSSEDWAEVEHGIGLFNAGRFWHAHEAWELVWQRQEQDERVFFQGLIQLAAAYHHLTRKQLRTGYVNNLRKSDQILKVFAPEYLGIEIAPLLEAIAAGLESADDLQDGPPAEGALRLIPRIGFRFRYDPDMMAAVKSAVADPDFVEGVALFNRGFHWEAHELWEEAARNAEGEGKTFLQGLSQGAAGLNFLKAGKRENAAYLFLKSVENLRRFGGLGCGVEFMPLVEWMTGAVRGDPSGPRNGDASPGAHPPIGLTGPGR